MISEGDKVKLKDKFFYKDGSKKSSRENKPTCGWWSGSQDFKNPRKGQIGEVINVGNSRVYIDFTEGRLDPEKTGYTDFYTAHKKDIVVDNYITKIETNYKV